MTEEQLNKVKSEIQQVLEEKFREYCKETGWFDLNKISSDNKPILVMKKIFLDGYVMGRKDSYQFDLDLLEEMLKKKEQNG